MRMLAFAVCLLVAVPLLADSPKIVTIAGTGKPKPNGVGAALETNVGQPFGVEVGPDGALYIAEVENHRVLRLDPKSKQITVVAGTGEPGIAGDGGLATEAQLIEPYELRFDADDNLYIVDMKGNNVRRVSSKTKKIETLAGTGKAGFSGDGGPATKAQLSQPHSIVVDPAGENLYIADIANHRIRHVNLKTGIIDTLAGNGQKSLPSEGLLDATKPLIGPRALFLDGDTLWIALREGHSVWRLDLPTKQLTHVAGDGKAGFAGDGGPAKTARFNGPKGIALGPNHDLFVVDTENQTIRRIDLDNATVSTVAGQGPKARGGAGDGGSATEAEMDRPHGVCVGADGTVYIGDTNNHRVRIVEPKK
ncbi:hypothetical protein LOC68_27805 [Blastopirellula sp. JC732]|uniref:SMP-30/Gluconolactonase/LRE-like region domain-containing protein n=1 Tax=Blastopirellula sediminis TaxID=2894196 RepID=A0A9X1SJN7_9BACT|nr:hypothetical protein [Blastopirellula sediminis]MCC9604485.1 hypothetical protein [Blastopirellula sediminis]MCC9632216.1 hypothetical protein [Blastopirellula sediminis]